MANASELQPITGELPRCSCFVAVLPGKMIKMRQLQVEWTAAAVDLPRLPCGKQTGKSPNQHELPLTAIWSWQSQLNGASPVGTSCCIQIAKDSEAGRLEESQSNLCIHRLPALLHGRSGSI